MSVVLLKQVAFGDVTDVTDVPFVLKAEMLENEVKEFVLKDEWVSEPYTATRSKQPKHIGFPYVIHAPTESVKKVHTQVLRGWISIGVEFKESAPLFYKGDASFTRIRIKNGDITTAVRVRELLKQNTTQVFANWK